MATSDSAKSGMLRTLHQSTATRPSPARSPKRRREGSEPPSTAVHPRTRKKNGGGKDSCFATTSPRVGEVARWNAAASSRQSGPA